MNRELFFDAIRRDPFDGSLNQQQVDGVTAILDEWDRQRLTDPRWLAYMLATAKHETAHTMQPIAEYGRGKGRKYGRPGKHGQVAYGRGYVQLTWDDNYERADNELGMGGALIADYDLALRPDIAAAILFRGMIEGWFTGRKLSDYFKADKTDWKNARRIINGTDKAATIARIAIAFHSAILLATTGDAVEPEPVRPAAKAPTAEATVTLVALLAGWLTDNATVLVAVAGAGVALALLWRFRNTIKTKLGFAT